MMTAADRQFMTHCDNLSKIHCFGICKPTTNWTEFGAFVHQQIVWIKSRPVLTHSVYLWQHEPCLFGWIKGERPKTLRAQVGQTAGEFPTTVWEIPSSEVETDAHPTSKPCRLFSLPMEMHTEPGDLCYEPFSGSGSQLIAA